MRHHMINGERVAFTATEETAQDAKEKEWEDGRLDREVRAELIRLEGTIDDRWVRNAVLGDQYAKDKITGVEALMDIERAKVTPQ